MEEGEIEREKGETAGEIEREKGETAGRRERRCRVGREWGKGEVGLGRTDGPAVESRPAGPAG